MTVNNTNKSDVPSEEEVAAEEAALGVMGEGDSPTGDDRVGTLEHVEDFPSTAPAGAKPASLEEILRKERESKG